MTDTGSLSAGGGETLPLSSVWFRRERERLAISRRVLAQRLQVPQGRIATLEMEQRAVPASWIKILSELEFRIPLSCASSAEPEVPAQPEQLAAEQTGSLAEDTQAGAHAVPAARKRRFRRVDGRWLRVERERLGYSRQALQSHLKQVAADTYAFVEGRRLVIPAHWRPVLHRLEKAESMSGVKEEAESSAPASAPPATEKAAELVELILSYRLKFGRSSGQTPVEILAWITHDLRQSGAEAAISFDAVERAVLALRSPKAE